MCLIVLKNTEEKIAEEDIVCYKRISFDRVSPHHFFKYEFNVKYDTTFSILEDGVEIGENSWFADSVANQIYSKYFDIYSKSEEVKVYQQGFHSYKSSKVIHFEREPNVVCIIPKGTKYIEDESGLICSESIIILHFL